MEGLTDAALSSKPAPLASTGLVASCAALVASASAWDLGSRLSFAAACALSLACSIFAASSLGFCAASTSSATTAVTASVAANLSRSFLPDSNDRKPFLKACAIAEVLLFLSVMFRGIGGFFDVLTVTMQFIRFLTIL